MTRRLDSRVFISRGGRVRPHALFRRGGEEFIVIAGGEFTRDKERPKVFRAVMGGEEFTASYIESLVPQPCQVALNISKDSDNARRKV